MLTFDRKAPDPFGDDPFSEEEAGPAEDCVNSEEVFEFERPDDHGQRRDEEDVVMPTNNPFS